MPPLIGPLFQAGGDEFFAFVTTLISGDTGTVGLETITPEIGPQMNWVLFSGSQPSQVDGEVALFGIGGTKSIYWKESAGSPSAGWQSPVGTPVGNFTGDFTVEFDIYIVNWTNDIECLGKYLFTERQWRLALGAGGGGGRVQISTSGGNQNSIFSQELWSTEVQALNTWMRISLSRVGDDWYLHLNGEASANSPLNNASVLHVPVTDRQLAIGQESPGGGAGTTEAFMTNLRITDGVGRYTVDYVPEPGPFPNF